MTPSPGLRVGLPQPIAGRVLGIDTSVSQGRLNVPLLVAVGARFIIAKATDGVNSMDGEWLYTAASCAEAKSAGVLDWWTGYHVLEPYGLDKVTAQVEHFVNTVKGVGITMAPMLDFELAHGLSGRVALQAARQWRDAVQQSLGCEVIFYVGLSFFETLVKYAGPDDPDVAALGDGPICVADYTQDHMKLPARLQPPLDKFIFWQSSGGHSESRNYATLPGTATDVDVDWFMGDEADLPAGP